MSHLSEKRAAKAHFGVHQVAAEDLPVDVDALKQRLTETLLSPLYAPPMLPTVALKVLALSTQPNVSMRTLVNTFEQDPLAGRVLKAARCPSFSADASSVRTMQDAAVRLGIRSMRDIVLELSLSTKVFRAEGFTEVSESLRRHSSAVARISRLVCRLGNVGADDAFLSGLFHDIGIVAALMVVGQDTQAARPSVELVWPAALEIHERVGLAVCQAWQLPLEVQRAVSTHHSFSGRPGDEMAAAIALADALSTELGAPPVAHAGLFEPRSESQLARAAAIFDFSSEKLKVLREKSLEVIAELDT